MDDDDGKSNVPFADIRKYLQDRKSLEKHKEDEKRRIRWAAKRFSLKEGVLKYDKI